MYSFPMNYYRLMDLYIYAYLYTPMCSVFDIHRERERGCPDAIIKHACATHNYTL